MQQLLNQFENYCQTPGIESGKARSYAKAIEYLCDYLNITPEEFFMGENNNPVLIREITDNLKKLNDLVLILII